MPRILGRGGEDEDVNGAVTTRKGTTRSLKEVAYPKPLRECGIEELAVHQITATPSGGIMFARKAEHDAKDHARITALSLFHPDRFNGLSILTMPGLNWKFEAGLLSMREGKWQRMKGPRRTNITCIECDRVIYHAALIRMPGIRQEHSVVAVLPSPSFAEHAVGNKWINRYYFGNIDDLMEQRSSKFDAAWLDYTGPLSVKRMRIVEKFFAERIRSTLVVTALKARWNRDTSDAIERTGGHSAWVRKHLPGTIQHDIEYQDGASPMSQIAIAKATHP